MGKREGKQYIFLMFICLISMVACGNKRKIDKNDNFTVIPTVEGIGVTPAVPFTPSDMKTIVYYTLSDAMEKEEVTALLPEETDLTPEYLVHYVTQAMEASAVVVKVDAVTVSGSSVIVSFAQDTVPVCDADAELEGEILDAIAQSILENFSEFASIIYQVMGEAYVSQNRSFRLNQVYLGN